MAEVTFKWNRDFWGTCMTSPALKSALGDAASKQAAAANARIGQPSHRTNLRNDNFYTEVVTRQGSSSPYCVGLVKAGNPRSIYKAEHGQAF